MSFAELSKYEPVSNSGVWIGPTGKKWCQLPLAAASPGDPIYYPPGTGPVDAPPYLGVPAPPAPPLTDTAIIPPGEGPGPVAPDSMVGPGSTDIANDVLPGPGVGYPKPGPGVVTGRSSGIGGKLLIAAAGAGLIYYFVKKRKKRGKK